MKWNFSTLIWYYFLTFLQFQMVFQTNRCKLSLSHSSRNNNWNNYYPESSDVSYLAWWNVNWVFLSEVLAKCWFDEIRIYIVQTSNPLSCLFLDYGEDGPFQVGKHSASFALIVDKERDSDRVPYQTWWYHYFLQLALCTNLLTEHKAQASVGRR